MSYLSVDTIRRYSSKGILPTYRTPGNHRRFRLADIEALHQRSTAVTAE